MVECGYDYVEPETGEFFKESDLVSIIEIINSIKKQFESIPDPREPGRNQMHRILLTKHMRQLIFKTH